MKAKLRSAITATVAFSVGASLAPERRTCVDIHLADLQARPQLLEATGGDVTDLL